jgi:hypothetical protein
MELRELLAEECRRGAVHLLNLAAFASCSGSWDLCAWYLEDAFRQLEQWAEIQTLPGISLPS